MISAGDIRGAILRLGGGSTNDTNLFEIVAKKQRERLESARFSVQFWKNRGANGVKELADWEKRVAEIEKTISELENKYKNILKDDCTICYSEITNPILLPCCQNVFCGGCIMKWMETTKTCPMCRAIVNVKEIVYINVNDKGDGKEEKKEDLIVKPKTKPQTVLDIVSGGIGGIGGIENKNKDKKEKEKKKKYLIFSMYDESFSTIRRELEEHKMDYVEISGSKATRDAKLKRFKEGKVDIVFLNSRFNGAGINLEMATDIILYHEMPRPIEDQVIGRALRIGRQGNLTVHHLCLE
jgi:SNF2 family DNA or RNA helicase